MKHAVHLTSVHHPFDPRIFHKQLTTLAKNGYKTTLICHHSESTRRNGVHVSSVADVDSRIERWKNLPTIAKYAKQEQADVYHFHDPELLPIGLYLSKSTKAKIIYDVHEDYSDAIRVREWIPKGVKSLLTWLFPQIESKIANSLDYIITADNSTQEKIADRVNTPVTSLRNFPRTESITIRDARINRHHEIILAYVGGLDRERGLMNMLKLIAELRRRGIDVGLWLIGDFQSKEIENKARRYMGSTGITDNVRLFGYVDYEEIFTYLSLADIGLLLADESRFERNVPTKFFEYLYAGLPVVLTEIDSLNEYLDPSYCISVPNKESQIVAGVLDMVSDSNEIAQMGKAGHERVKSEYCWEVESIKLIDIYTKLLN